MIKRIRRFFWHCAGANVQILEGCESDHSRYVNIGATILMTALLAWVSMGFALYSVFKSETAAVLAGCVWACMIFVLDRTIVTSMRKPSKVNIKAQSGESAYGTGSKSWRMAWEGIRELVFLLIRFLVAILVAVVITKPLEVKIFEGRLKVELSNMQAQQFKLDSMRPENESGLPLIEKSLNQLEQSRNSLAARIARGEKSPEYLSLEQTFSNHESQIASDRSSTYQDIRFYDSQITTLQQKIDFDSPANQLRIDGWKAKRAGAYAKIDNLEAPGRVIKKKMADEKDRYDSLLNAEMVKLDNDISIQNTKRGDAISKSVRKQEELKANRETSFDNSIIPQIEALESLKSHDPAIWWTSTLIMLLFITVELGPVLAKLLSKRGAYDDAIEAYEVQRWLEIQTETATQINEMNVRGEASNAKLEAERRRLELWKKDLEEDHQAARDAKVELDSRKHAAALEKELASYSELVERIAAAQKEIALLQVEIWKKEQLDKLNGRT